jgi:hypothetical protein
MTWIYDWLYAPVAVAVLAAAERLNYLQFLYHPPLSAACVLRARLPAHGAGAMAVILDLAVQGVQMLLVLGARAAAHRVSPAKSVRASSGRRGAPLLQPYRDLVRLLRKDAVLAENASWLFRVIPYLVFRRHLGRRRAGPDLRDRAHLLLVGRT